MNQVVTGETQNRDSDAVLIAYRVTGQTRV